MFKEGPLPHGGVPISAVQALVPGRHILITHAAARNGMQCTEWLRRSLLLSQAGDLKAKGRRELAGPIAAKGRRLLPNGQIAFQAATEHERPALRGTEGAISN